MQLRENYDWVVLGDHVGALLGAALAARLGLAVLILPAGQHAKVLLSKEGDCLDPEPNFMIGVSRAEKNLGLLAECFTHLGVFPAEELRVLSQQGLPQVLGPKTRLSLVASNEGLEKELKREFGSERFASLQLLPILSEAEPSFHQYWRELPKRLSLPVNPTGKGARPSVSFKGLPHGIRDLKKRLLKSSGQTGLARNWLHPTRKISQLKSVSQDHDLAQAFLGLRYGIVCHSSSDPTASEMLELLSMARTGGAFQGGISAFRELLLRVAKRHGAEIFDQARVERILVENGRLTGLEFVQGSGSASVARKINARGALLGSSLTWASGHLASSGRAWWRRLKAAPTPTGWRFTVALRLNSEAIPPGMSSRMIWKEGGAPVLEIETANPSDYGLLESGSEGARASESSPRESSETLVFLRTMMPFEAETLTPGFQRMMAARMMRKFMELIPFSEYHMVRVYPDFRDPSSEADFSKVYGFASLDAIPANLRCFSGPGVGSLSGIEGLFVASDEAYPGMGSFGGCVAALEAVAWLAHRSGLPGPLA